MQEYNLDYINKNQTLSDTQNNDYYKELKQKDTVQVFLAQSKHSKTENLSKKHQASSLLPTNTITNSSVLRSKSELDIGQPKIFGQQEPSGIYKVIYRYSNFDTILNVVAQCFRAITLMASKITPLSRKIQITKGFDLKRVPPAISAIMTENDKKLIHITPHLEEIIFAKNFLISEAQKYHYPDEYY